MICSSAASQHSINPLFTLQHSSASRSTKGNGVTSICFLTKDQGCSTYSQTSTNNSCDSDDCDDSVSSSDSESSLQFKSQGIGKMHSLESLKLHSSTIDARSTLSFDNTFLASTHANGNAYIWDLSKRRVVKNLDDGEGPGVVLGAMPNGRFFHQRRSEAGSISIFDDEYNVVQKIDCRSQTFCQATSSFNHHFNHHNDLLLVPSEHASFAQFLI